MKRKFIGTFLIAACLFAIIQRPAWSVSVDINVSGAEHDTELHDDGTYRDVPGVYIRDYKYPSDSEIEEHASQGFDRIRLPFRWERLQPRLYGPLDPAELNRLKHVVTTAQHLGMGVTLDVHNYGDYIQNGSKTTVERNSFTDFWRKLATEFKDDANVWFGLMNEPRDLSVTKWMEIARSAILAIRDTGAQNKILVSGTRWANAHRHFDGDAANPSNATALLTLKSLVSRDNLIFEVHAYPDIDTDGDISNAENWPYAGDDPSCESSTILSENLKDWVVWLRNNGLKGYVGEYAVSDSILCQETLLDFLKFAKRNSDVIVGHAYWAGGTRLADYHYLISEANGKGRAQLNTLRPFLNRDDNEHDLNLEIVRVSNSGDGFAVYENSSRSWVSPECMTRITDAGHQASDWSWSDLSILPDAVQPLNCDELIAEMGREMFTVNEPTLAGILGAGSGFLMFPDNTFQQVNSLCVGRLRSLQLASIIITDIDPQYLPENLDNYISFSDLSNWKPIAPALSCNSLIEKLSTTDDDWIVALVSHAGDGFLIHPDDTRQWLSPSCINQLDSAGVPLTRLPWAEVGPLPDATETVTCTFVEQKLGN